jgi:hypothetical protein
MIRRRPDQKTSAQELTRATDDFHEWALSLPWVVERPYSSLTPGVRAFAVDCEPLDRRQMWLVTGIDQSYVGDPGIAVIVSLDDASEIEYAGWGRRLAPMPAGHVLLTVNTSVVSLLTVEAIALRAYSASMA